jgi:hypothetical protein
MVVRAGWQWVTVEGQAEIIGPDDPHADVNASIDDAASVDTHTQSMLVDV